MDEVPQVHVPAREVREWRVLIEHRRRLVDKRVATKNGLRALFGLGQGDHALCFVSVGTVASRKPLRARPATKDYVQTLVVG